MAIITRCVSYENETHCVLDCSAAMVEDVAARQVNTQCAVLCAGHLFSQALCRLIMPIFQGRRPSHIMESSFPPPPTSPLVLFIFILFFSNQHSTGMLERGCVLLHWNSFMPGQGLEHRGPGAIPRRSIPTLLLLRHECDGCLLTNCALMKTREDSVGADISRPDCCFVEISKP